MQRTGFETAAVAQHSQRNLSGATRELVQPRACENSDTYSGHFCAGLARFRQCVDGAKHFGPATIEASISNGMSALGSRNREFSARFIELSQYTLSAFEYRLFNYHFLLGANSVLCCRKMNIDLNTFSETVRQLQEKVGKALATTVSVESTLEGDHPPLLIVHRLAA